MRHMFGRSTGAKDYFLQLVVVLGGFWLIRAVAEYYDFAPYGTIFKAGNLAVITVALLGVYWFKSRRDLSEIGLGKPKSWWRVIIVTALTIVAVAIVANVLSPILVEMFGVRENTRFHELEGNFTAFILTTVLLAWFGAAFCEEVVFRGLIMTRVEGLLRAWGHEKLAVLSAVIIQAVLFGLLHIYQGMEGVMMAGSISLIFGVAYYLGGRSLIPLIIVHAVPDTMTLLAMYGG